MKEINCYFKKPFELRLKQKQTKLGLHQTVLFSTQVMTSIFTQQHFLHIC